MTAPCWPTSLPSSSPPTNPPYRPLAGAPDVGAGSGDRRQRLDRRHPGDCRSLSQHAGRPPPVRQPLPAMEVRHLRNRGEQRLDPRLDADYMMEPALHGERPARVPDPGDGGLPGRVHLLHGGQAAARLALSRATRAVPSGPRGLRPTRPHREAAHRRPCFTRKAGCCTMTQEHRALVAAPIALSGRRGREARDAAVVGAELARPAGALRLLGPRRRRGPSPFRQGLVSTAAPVSFYTAQRVTADMILSMHLLRRISLGK